MEGKRSPNCDSIGMSTAKMIRVIDQQSTKVRYFYEQSSVDGREIVFSLDDEAIVEF